MNAFFRTAGKALSITGLAALLAAGAASPAQAGDVVVAMTAADIPDWTGQPDQGMEGYRFVGYSLYESLIGWDLSSADAEVTYKPALATEWHVDPQDNTRWIFSLRQGVSFHDGCAWNADTAVWNFQRLLDDHHPAFNPGQFARARARLAEVAKVEKLDDYTIAFTTKSVSSLFPNNIPYVLMISKCAVEAAGNDYAAVAKAPAGTGPYVFESAVPHERLVLARNTKYCDDKVTLACLGIIALVILAAAAAPLIAPADPYATSMINRLRPVGFAGHLLGTDELGRDMLSRLIHGGRLSLAMGILPVALAVLIGGFLGIIAGYAGGKTNMVIMRVMDIFYAFPSVLLAVAISGTLGGGLASSLLALTLVFIPSLCRVAETVTSQIHAQDFVDAARASGAPAHSIILTHVVGNVLPPVFIYASSLISVSILLAAGLSFLGLGVQPPLADWGQMLSGLRQAIYVQPLVCALPGIAIFILSLAFNLLGDGLRQAMDVRA